MKDISRYKKWLWHEKKGITLTELIVASIMIGIVMVGVASFATTIQRLQSSTSKSVIIAMKVKAAMARMSDDAYAKIGEYFDPGYQIRSPGGNDRSICFRHDVAITPEDYTDDEWTCYYRDDQNVLFLCGPDPTVTPDNDGQCDGTGTRKELIGMIQNDFFDIVEIADVPNNRLEYIDLHIFARFDPAIGPHPISNPEYSVTTKISPPGQSR